jgi:hypothetical protein
MRGGFIKKFIIEYEDCLYPRKSTCKYDNVRFHSVDLRAYSPSVLMSTLGRLVNAAANDTDPEMIKEDGEDLIKEFEDNDEIFVNEKSFEKYINKIKASETLKIGRGMKNVREEIKEVMEFEFQNIINNSTIYVDGYATTKLEFYKQKDNILKGIAPYFSSKSKNFLSIFTSLISLLFMDLYTMSRMFRTLGKSGYPKNVIFQGGSGHVIKLRSMLKRVDGFEEVFYTNNISNCSPVINTDGQVFLTDFT